MASNRYIDRISSFLVQNRYKVLIAFLIFWIAFTSGATRIKTEVILRDLFPYDHPYLKLHARFAEIFGGGGYGVVIAVKAEDGDIFNQKTLTKIKDITDELVLWDEVYRVLTISIASNSVKVVKTKAKGEIVIDTLMFPEVPKTAQEIELLKKHIFSNPSYNGTLVSRDGEGVLVLTQLKEFISYEKAFALFRDLQARYSDGETSIHIVGYPMLMGWIYSYKTQMYWVFGISVALMVLILFLIFRNFVGMIAPIAMALICTGLGLGFIGWTGINFSPLLYVLAFLVGARMLSNAVQITHRYIYEYQVNCCLDGPRRVAGCNTMGAMLMPNAAAVATDAAGFLVLALAKIVLMQQLAILMSFWMITIALSGFLVPLICCSLPRLTTVKPDAIKKETWFDRVTIGISRFSIGSGKWIIGVGAITIVVFGVWQTTKLKVGDPTPGSSILWPDHPYNQDQAFINQTFDVSSEDLMLYYEGDAGSVYDPFVMKTFEAFDRYMAKHLPDIYKSSSAITDMAKMLNLTFHDGDQIWFQMPSQAEQVTGLLGYIRNNIDRNTLGRYMDPTLKRAQITVYFSDHTSDNMLRIRDAAYNFFEDNRMETDRGRFLLAGGSIGMEIAVNEEMRRTHALMDTLVLIVIFLMCMLAFRSFVAGAMLAAPLILSNLVAFSYMSINNIGLSTNTLPCSAVGVGVGVDFAIYLYSRCMEEFPKSHDWQQTVLTAVRTAGKGIVFTGLTLILPILPWAFISALKFQAQMGFFLAMLLFTNMVAALTLHPLLILIIKPRFMTQGTPALVGKSRSEHHELQSQGGER